MTHFNRTAAVALSIGALAFSCASVRPESATPEPTDDLHEEAVELAAEEEPGEARPPMMPMAPRLTGDGVFYVLGEDPTRPLARYSDGQLAMSNSCGIKLGNKLNRRIPPIYVNGQPIGFC